LVDIAGIVKGASEGEGLGNKFLSHIREVDAILQVVRCFEDPDVTHVAGKVDPVSDMETIEMELLFADIQSVETALPKAERAARTGDKEAKFRVGVIQKCLEHLNSEQPLRSLKLEEAEAKAIRSFGLMTAKPILYIANVDESDLHGADAMVQQVRTAATKRGPWLFRFVPNLRQRSPNLRSRIEMRCLQPLGSRSQPFKPLLGKRTRHSACRVTLQQERKRFELGPCRSGQPLRKRQESSTQTLNVVSSVANVIALKISKSLGVKKRSAPAER
jgi:hypothetical protein